jgi:hypothetical protein
MHGSELTIIGHLSDRDRNQVKARVRAAFVDLTRHSRHLPPGWAGSISTVTPSFVHDLA